MLAGSLGKAIKFEGSSTYNNDYRGFEMGASRLVSECVLDKYVLPQSTYSKDGKHVPLDEK